VQLRVLGTLELIGRRGPVPVTGDKRRALLALLTVHAGEALSVDRIVEELWGGRAQGAQGTVQTYVSQLRKVLRAGDGLRIETVSGAYRLVADDGAVDTHAFLAESAAALAAADPAERLELTESALRRWQGAPLTEFAGQRWADEAIQALEQRRLGTVEAHAGALLALGRDREAVAELERAVAEHPLHERLWSQYATALYRVGRQADALRAVGEIRRVLADELGVDPGPELTELERRILDHDPALAVAGVEHPSVQPRLAHVPTGGLQGRAEERAQLHDAWERVRAGGTEVVTLAGEPGIGKTTLAGWMAREVDREGGLAAGGRADEDLGLPYQVWAEALEHLVRQAPAELLETYVGSHGASLTTLVPSLHRRLGAPPARVGGDPETERFITWASAISLVRMLSERVPVLLVLDDLHWADAPSLELLHHAVRSKELGRVLLIVTYRDSELTEQLGNVVATLGREGARQRTLGRLTLAETIALTDSLAGASNRALGEVVHRETGGNPFFTEELVRHLAESGALFGGADAIAPTDDDLAAIGLPAGVEGLVRRRVTRLGDDAEQLLTVAAVIGTKFDRETLGASIEWEPHRVLATLEGVRAAALVVEVEPGWFAFSHALVAHSLVSRLGPSELAAFHERVARAIEASPDADRRVGELAHHWGAAGAGARETAIEYARRAGDRALDVLAPSEATEWYAKGIELDEALHPRGRSLRAELMVAKGRAEQQAGNPAHRQTLLDAAVLAQESGQGDRLVDAALANSRGFASNVLEPDRERRAVLEAALDVAPDDATRARLLAALALEHQFQNVVLGAELQDRAVQLARSSGDPRALLAALIAAPTTPPVSRAGAALRTTEEAAAIAAALGDPALEFLTTSRLAIGRLRAGQDWRADADRRDQLAARLGVPIMRWRSLWYRAAEQEVTGQHDEATATCNEALELGVAMGQPDTIVIYGTILSASCYHRDQFEQMRDLAQLGMTNFPQMDSFRPSLTYASFGCGDRDRARELFAEDAAAGFVFAPSPGWPSAVTCSAINAAFLDDAGAAERLLDLLRPFETEITTTIAFHLGAFAYYLGELDLVVGDLDAAASDLGRAEEMHRRLGMPAFLCRTQLARARLALRRGEPDAAIPLLEEGARLADAHDLGLSQLHAAELGRSLAVVR
jgi:DNA-binding SARP family transcriptional activator